MTQPRTPTSQRDLLRALWLKAAKEGRIVLTFADKAQAERTRIGLYSAVKPVREGVEIFPLLLEAVNSVTINKISNPDGSVTLKLENVLESEASQTILQALGDFDLSLAKSPDTRPPGRKDSAEVEDSVQKFLERVGK